MTRAFMPVPCYDSRNGLAPQFVVIHIGEGSANAITQEFLNSKNEKSSHYLIKRNGTVIQFVDEKYSAWANGIVWNPSNELIKDLFLKGVSINKVSISIEAEGYANQDPTEAYYKSCSGLVREICAKYKIPIHENYIIPHRAIRKDKTCPGRISVGKIISLAQESLTPKIHPIMPATAASAPAQTSMSAWMSNFLYRTKVTFGFADPVFGGVPRASDWYIWRKMYIHVTCDFCGIKGTLLKPLELHHCYPYHLDPSKEKDPNNVVTLCRTCHQDHGHLKSFHSYNPDIKEDIKIFRAKVVGRP